MRLLLPSLLLLSAACLPIQASQPAPVGVDALSQDDVSKAVSALKQTFVRPDALSDPELARATLQGLMDRLAPEASLVTGTGQPETASPFYSEIYAARTGYLRLGELTPENVDKAKQALKSWSPKNVAAVVLDLRGTPASSDFETGAALEALFCAKGTGMFTLYAGNAAETGSNSAPEGHVFSAPADPLFTGILVVLVDEATAESPEAIAASLQKCAKALVVGDTTAGRAFQYRDVPLNGALLRVAVAQVLLPDGKKLGDTGLKPDIDVPLGATPKASLMQTVSAKGVESVIQEHDRPHLNEAALVSGSNPEVDEIEAEESGTKPPAPLIDRQLQSALDLVTSISIYQAKAATTPNTGE
jgi:C-terminal processing protease CtpA/Prc